MASKPAFDLEKLVIIVMFMPVSVHTRNPRQTLRVTFKKLKPYNE
jgi:hypothetical protein